MDDKISHKHTTSGFVLHHSLCVPSANFIVCEKSEEAAVPSSPRQKPFKLVTEQPSEMDDCRRQKIRTLLAFFVISRLAERMSKEWVWEREKEKGSKRERENFQRLLADMCKIARPVIAQRGWRPISSKPFEGPWGFFDNRVEASPCYGQSIEGELPLQKS